MAPLHTIQATRLALMLLLAVTAFIYFPGLDGVFMFDDIVHVSKNNLVAITGFTPDQLNQAWNASPFDFPSSRPLSMLSFGINHIFSGFDPFWFKATNLLIHLLCGIGLFILTRLAGKLFSLAREVPIPEHRLNGWALLTAALWLLHPLNLTPVLYVVQRMTSLAALFMILAMILYLQARIRLLEGRGGRLLILLGVPALGLLAFLSKENAILLPALLLTMEVTLFGFKASTPGSRRFLQLFFLFTAVIPAIGAIAFLLLNPDWLLGGYSTRQFTLPERLLSEARILWFYLQMLLAPDNSLMGFYHDDFQLSRGLLDPPTTLLAVSALIGLLLLALWACRTAPVLAFGILFFLVGHSLESSIISLELIYEHRNYLPDFGLLFALAYYLIAAPRRRWQIYGGALVAIIFVGACTAKTALRVQDWSSEISMALAEAIHHPDSPRANFRAGQLLINNLPKSKKPEQTYQLARYHLERTVTLNPRNADGLFGLIVLNLHMNKPVEQRWLDELKQRLEHVPYDPQNISTGQFSYLVRWHMSNGPKLPQEEVLAIFNAVLRNPALDHFARAGIHAALRAYYHKVLGDTQSALKHGREAVKAWPQRWYYQDRLIRLMLELGMPEEAEQQLRQAREADINRLHTKESQALEQLIRSTRGMQERSPPGSQRASP